MPIIENADQSFPIQQWDRFYGLYFPVGILSLTLGVPFVFYQKAAAAVVGFVLTSASGISSVWRIS